MRAVSTTTRPSNCEMSWPVSQRETSSTSSANASSGGPGRSTTGCRTAESARDLTQTVLTNTRKGGIISGGNWLFGVMMLWLLVFHRDYAAVRYRSAVEVIQTSSYTQS
ncbi:hypothetical protein DFP72DRAFT_1162501 [Ephemerocybe angulata]|uniref:Uncharacterized protein n=1 Tax=Ephemerocybe angulata TaxID=980116 RepID=A0A8H6MHM3_9AGAR|nr:hypothetical protein DFP72DRAFT_1162501 [Tulosesus angulatus]